MGNPEDNFIIVFLSAIMKMENVKTKFINKLASRATKNFRQHELKIFELQAKRKWRELITDPK